MMAPIKGSDKKKHITKFQIILIVFLIVIGVIGVFYFFIPWLSSQPVRLIETKTKVGISEGNKIKMTLFFSLEDRLATEEREVPLRSGDLRAQVGDILKELVKGPVKNLKLTPLLPEETKIKGIFIDSNGICYLDFSRDIQEKFPGGVWTEFLSLYSIVNTLATNFPGIKGVQILVEGYGVETLAGHIDIRYPLHPREDLIVK